MPFLDEPRLRGVAPGSAQFFELQRQIIRERPLIREVYETWYRRLMADARAVSGDGQLLELGSGGSYLRELCPELITSDVVAGVADQVIDGRALPFEDESLRAIFVTHVFHHIPDVEAFLREADRALVPGGVVSMIEVPHTPFARFFFDRFHPEPYDDDASEWSFESSDAMMDANQALSWNVFFRDRARFERLFPRLTLTQSSFMPWLGYLLSGGVTRRNLVPSRAEGAVRVLERIARPLDPVMALHWHLTLTKK